MLDATDISEVDGKITRNRLKEAARKITAFCRRPKYGSFLQLEHELVPAEVDFSSNGNAVMEVIEANREAGAPVVGMSHARSAHFRVNPTRTLWVQGLTSSTYDAGGGPIQMVGRYYRVFGDDDPNRRFVDRFTGEFFRDWPSTRSEDRKGTAVLHAKSYCPLDAYYGMGIHVPALNAILENDMVSRFMIAFSEGGMRIPVLVVVEGGNLTPDSMEKIEAVFNSDAKADEGAGRAAVIQPTVDGSIGANTKIRVERVDLGISDMAPLFARQGANNAEILEAARMSGIFLGGGDGAQLTSRNAGVLKQLTYEHALEPRTAFWEALLSNGIAPRITSGAVFKIRRSANLDPLQVASLLAKVKDGLTVTDMRLAVKQLVEGVELPVLRVQDGDDVPMALLDLAQQAQAASTPESTTAPPVLRMIRGAAE